MIFIGIDPGLTGAVAVMDEEGKLAYLFDIPTVPATMGSAKVKNRVDGCAFHKDMIEFSFNSRAIIELVHAMPDQGVSSVFSFGATFGTILCAVEILAIPYELVTPRAWKKEFKLSREKEAARHVAIQLWGSEHFKLKKHQNRAEACLIAEYGRRKCLWNESSGNRCSVSPAL